MTDIEKTTFYPRFYLVPRTLLRREMGRAEHRGSVRELVICKGMRIGAVLGGSQQRGSSCSDSGPVPQMGKSTKRDGLVKTAAMLLFKAEPQ